MRSPGVGTRGVPQACPDVLEEQHEVERVAGQLLEGRIEVRIEPGGSGRLGVNQKRANADLRRYRRDLEERVAKERPAKAAALFTQVDPEPRQDDDRDGTG
jgi:hypothetical protein